MVFFTPISLLRILALAVLRLTKLITAMSEYQDGHDLQNPDNFDITYRSQPVADTCRIQMDIFYGLHYKLPGAFISS